eukprot:8878810-Pyramimonas_sp.AAC.1
MGGLGGSKTSRLGELRPPLFYYEIWSSCSVHEANSFYAIAASLGAAAACAPGSTASAHGRASSPAGGLTPYSHRPDLRNDE